MVWGDEDPADYRISIPKAHRVKVKHKPTGATHVIDTTRDDDEQLVEVIRLLHEIAIELEEEAGGQYQTVTMKWALKAIAMHTDLDNEPTDIDGLIEFFDYPLSRCAVVFE